MILAALLGVASILLFRSGIVSKLLESYPD
jgi:hypothetical protein